MGCEGWDRTSLVRSRSALTPCPSPARGRGENPPPLVLAVARRLRSFIRHTDSEPAVAGLRAVIHTFIPNRSTQIVDNSLAANRQMWRFFNQPTKRLMPQGLDRDIHSLAHATSTSAVENPDNGSPRWWSASHGGTLLRSKARLRRPVTAGEHDHYNASRFHARPC